MIAKIFSQDIFLFLQTVLFVFNYNKNKFIEIVKIMVWLNLLIVTWKMNYP